MGTSSAAVSRRHDRPPVRRVLEFYGLTAATALAPLIALPAITASGGAAGFAAVVLGQTLGAAASMVILMGWGLIGAHSVAVRRDSPEELQHVYWTSIVTRLLVAVLALPTVAIAAALLSPSQQAVAALGAAGAALVGLTSSWYFVGLGRTGLVAIYETLPQVAISVLGSVALWAGMPLIGFPMLTVAANLLVVVLTFLRLRGERSTRRIPGVRRIATSLKEQAPMLGGALATYAFTGFAVTLVATVAPPALPLFAALYRVQLLGRSLLFPFKNALQSWVSGSTDMDRARRTRTAVLVTTGAGLLIAVGMTVLTPLLDWMLFSNAIEVPVASAAAMASSLVFVSISLAFSAYVLIPAGLTHVSVISTVIGAAVGVPLLLVGAHIAGALGASLAIATTEMLVLGAVIIGQRVTQSRADRNKKLVKEELEQVAPPSNQS